MATSRILGLDGQPINLPDLAEPQSARLGALQHEMQQHPTRGLTPSKLARILDQAETGDLTAQSDLFEDMEEKDGHIGSEMSKRRCACLLEWDVVPPTNASALEKKNAELLSELLTDVPDFEDMLFDVTDAIGKGFSCSEIEWHRAGKWWLPKTITHRPQSWFLLHRGYRQELRLRTDTAVGGIQGEVLQPFGWITHTHKAKSGYLERSSLFRQLVWTYLFKNYSVGDLAEFLEIYGIPLRIGKYPPSSSEKDKATLLRALVGVGHNAAGIIPEGMALQFEDAATGDPAAFELMIDWCEKNQSKVILGGTLTSGADGKSSTNALGNIHNEVRKDLRDGDVRQLNSTLSRDLVYAIAALNGLAPDGIRRAPQMRLSAQEHEDLAAYAEALPKLVAIGVRPTVQWAHERLGIPQAESGEAVLGTQAAAPPPPPPPAPPGGTAAAAAAPPIAAAAATAPSASTDPLQAQTNSLVKASAPLWSAMAAQLQQLVDAAPDVATLQQQLVQAYGDLDSAELVTLMAAALALAELKGMDSARDDAAPAANAVAASAARQPTPPASFAEPTPDPRLDQIIANQARFQNSLDLHQAKEPLVIHNTIQLPEQLAPVVNNTVNLPEQSAPVINLAAPAITVQPAPVTINNTHPATAVQTVERDANDEIVRTVTRYQE